jgi:hypothetical protein
VLDYTIQQENLLTQVIIFDNTSCTSEVHTYLNTPNIASNSNLQINDGVGSVTLYADEPDIPVQISSVEAGQWESISKPCEGWYSGVFVGL